jgi:hypothetical protein
MGKKTPVVPLSNVRIRVRSRGGRAVAGADVSVDAPAATTQTGADGFAKLGFTEAQLNALSPAGQVTLHIKKRHHGPDPGAGNAIVPGEIKLTVTVTMKGFDPGTPGLVTDKLGSYLDVVLMDAGLNFGQQTAGTVTRRLTDDQVQKELMFRYTQGDVALTPETEFQFEHDTTSGEFAACDPAKCKLKAPAANQRVSIQKATIAGVKFIMLMSFAPSPRAPKTDQIPGQRFVRDKFGWANMTMALLDQRHVVGLARLCGELKAKHSVAAIYTQGVSGDTSRADAHGYGLALDFGGCATALPDPATSASATVRLGTDFVVFLHWGNHPMWNGTTVLAHPSDATQWTRLTVNDDGHDYSADPTAKTSRLHYRMDPAPFQDAVPAALATSDPALATTLATVAPHFVSAAAIFATVYAFATREYTDGTSSLGPLPAGSAPEAQTPIDSHTGHFILHPDYPKPNAAGAKNGRQAHVNHLHFQLGPTSYSGPRTK